LPGAAPRQGWLGGARRAPDAITVGGKKAVLSVVGTGTFLQPIASAREKRRNRRIDMAVSSTVRSR